MVANHCTSNQFGKHIFQYSGSSLYSHRSYQQWYKQCQYFSRYYDTFDLFIPYFGLLVLQLHGFLSGLFSGERILVDIKGKFSWTKQVNFRGHFSRILVDIFVHQNSCFRVIFRGRCFGEFSWTFLVNSHGHFLIVIIQVTLLQFKYFLT